MKELGLRHRFAGFVAVIILAFASAGTVQALFLKGQRNDWNGLREQALARQQLLAVIQAQMGYGALIHNFKNYVLRGQDSYYLQFTENHLAVTLGIKRYHQLGGLTMTERNALDNIQQVADQYLASATAVRDLLARGADSGSIDKSVKISDAPAVKGLADLQARNTELLAIYIQRIESRVDSAFTSVLPLMLASLVVVLLAGLLFYRYLAGRQRSLRNPPAGQYQGIAGEAGDGSDPVAGRAEHSVSRISLLSEETAAVVEQNKAVIAELDHKALQ